MTGSSGINGDNFYISPDQRIFVLADGASGAGKHGKAAMSSTCVDIARRFDFASAGLPPRGYVDALFHNINSALIELSQREGILCFGTIVAAFVEGSALWVTTYGDSPAYLLQRGKVVRAARNRKRYEDMVDDGIITQKRYDKYATNMHERMQGVFDRYIPEIVPNHVIEQYSLSPGDMFAACSDGLSDWIAPERIFEEIQRSGIEASIDELMTVARDKALRKQKYFDDITAIAFAVN